MSSTKSEGTRTSEFHLWRVVAVLLPLAVLMAVGAIVWGYYDVPQRLHDWMLPPLVEVRGQVFMNGKPLDRAWVYTKPVGIDAQGGEALADQEGRFSLHTNIKHVPHPGVYACEHRVIILRADDTAPVGPGQPPTITPPESESFDTTQLRLKAARDGSQGPVEFRLEYVKPAGTGKTGGKASGKGRPEMPGMPGMKPEA